MEAAELEQAPQQGRLVHPGEEQQVAADGRLDQGIEDVPAPARLVADERRGSGVAAEKEKKQRGG